MHVELYNVSTCMKYFNSSQDALILLNSLSGSKLDFIVYSTKYGIYIHFILLDEINCASSILESCYCLYEIFCSRQDFDPCLFDKNCAWLHMHSF